MENKNFWVLIGSNLLSIILVICGVLMAFKSIEGWGWLIFAGLLVYGSPKSILTIKNKKSGKSKETN
jgi:ABC-type multidrug transport system permease subunit